MSHVTEAPSILHRVIGKELQYQRQALRFTSAWAQKLANSKKFTGHEGCVNRLAWNEDGTLLASGSDDRQVLLWSYPDVDRSPLALQTDHAANIFGVQFMPCTNNSQIITGAMDDTVMLHNIERLPAQLARRSNGSAVPVAFQSTLYGCHRARVKGVEVEPNNPHVFWSAAEDGIVRQYDTRLSANSQKAWESSNCLLSVKATGPASSNRSVELKGISLNKAHVHQMAVAAGDIYVRVYDRRMLSEGGPKEEHIRAEPVLQMAPPHMCLINSNKRTGRAHTTCVNFGSRGDKLVATYHCDQAYTFDVSGTGSCTASYNTAGDDSMSAGSSQEADDVMAEHEPAAATSSHAQGKAVRQASAAALQRAEELKNEGNHAFFSRDLAKAVSYYSQALHLNPSSSMLHTNRAAALISRDWVGDAMWALKDCEAALRLDCSLAKAHYRRIQALKAMNQIQAAYTAVQVFQKRFPGAGEDAARLKEEVYAMLEERAQHAEQRRQRLLQKKRARDEAQARRQAPAESETAVLATGQQAVDEAQSSPDRMTRRHLHAGPSLPAVNTTRPTPRPATWPSGASPSARAASATSPSAMPPSAKPPSDAAEASAHQHSSSAGNNARVPGTTDPVPGSTAPGSETRQALAGPGDAPAAAHGNADELMLSQHEDETPTESQPSTEHAQPSHQSQSSTRHGTGQPDALPHSPQVSARHPFACQERPLQQGDPSQAKTMGQSTGLVAASVIDVPDANAQDQSHAHHISIRAVESDQSDEDEDAGLDQEGDSVMQDELDRLRDADPTAGIAFDAAAGEAELPEEGWMCEEIDGGLSNRQGLLDDSETWAQGVGGRRMVQRYVGHANVQTDIKEATFMGSHDDLVAAGSDDGSVFIYDAVTGQVIKILRADEDVANCVQCHPTLPVLATSGIEHTIKLWSPEGALVPLDPVDAAIRIRRNQERIMSGPQVLRSISPRVFQALHDNPQLLTLLRRGLASRQGDADQTDEEDEAPGNINCRVN